jgi:hypothetical protein
VDYLAPQVYWYIGQAGSDYKLLVPWWNENAFGRHIYVGLADYKMGTVGWTDPNQVANQIGMNRANQNVHGQIHFRHAFLAANTLNYRTALMQDTYKRPALLPAMPWKDSLPPGAPTALASSAGANNAVALSWAAPAAAGDEMEKAKRFVIYRSDQREMDIEYAGRLRAVRDGPGRHPGPIGVTRYTVAAVRVAPATFRNWRSNGSSSSSSETARSCWWTAAARSRVASRMTW